MKLLFSIICIFGLSSACLPAFGAFPERECEKKLIRDRLPEIYAAEGDSTPVQKVDRETQKEMILAKLIEELREFRETPTAEEMADLREVLYAMQILFGLSEEEVERIQLEKRERKGSFLEGFAIQVNPPK